MCIHKNNNTDKNIEEVLQAGALGSTRSHPWAKTNLHRLPKHVWRRLVCPEAL